MGSINHSAICRTISESYAKNILQGLRAELRNPPIFYTVYPWHWEQYKADIEKAIDNVEAYLVHVRSDEYVIVMVSPQELVVALQEHYDQFMDRRRFSEFKEPSDS